MGPVTDGPPSRLADRLQEVAEPGRTRVERLAAPDPRELDGTQLPATLLVVADDTGLAPERAVDGEVRALADEGEVPVIRRRGSREVPGLLHHRLLGAEQLRELLGEPG